MSRVDEALRRAAVTPIHSAGRYTAEVAAEPWNQSVLERYPREDQLDARSTGESTPSPDPPHSLQGVGSKHFLGHIVTPRFDKEYESRLVANGHAPATSIEQYRRLAGSLDHLQAEQGLRRLMVSSSVPREGKTLTVVNLAMTLSESYKRRVLLIDADLRRPSIHDVFGISNKYGLCDALQSEAGEIPVSRVSPALWVLPAGSLGANPMAALASPRMEQLLDEADSSFDWVLLDAPPIGLMADAGLLARLTRAVIVVIAADSTPYSVVEKMVAELGREQIIGTVLNRVEEGAAPWSGYYDRYVTSKESSKTPR